MTASATKAPKATTKAASTAPKYDDDVTIVGILRGTQEFIGQGPDAKYQVRGFLSIGCKDTFNGMPTSIDLPGDNFIASDNGVKLATELLALQNEHTGEGKWVKVALKGFWVPAANPELTNGYLKCNRKQLRVKSYQKLNDETMAKSATKQYYQPIWFRLGGLFTVLIQYSMDYTDQPEPKMFLSDIWVGNLTSEEALELIHVLHMSNSKKLDNFHRNLVNGIGYHLQHADEDRLKANKRAVEADRKLKEYLDNDAQANAQLEERLKRKEKELEYSSLNEDSDHE